MSSSLSSIPTKVSL